MKEIITEPIVIEAALVILAVIIARLDPSNKVSGWIIKAGELLIKLGDKLTT